MRLLLAFDSFKGSLTSLEAAEAFGEGWHAADPTADIVAIEVADGGEGTAAALVSAQGGEWREVEVSNPVGRTITSRYGIAGKRAIIESAAACGLTLIDAEEHNPLKTTTYGVGELIADAINNGYRDIVICLGGSATNDGGVGMLQALGYRFLASDGRELRGGGEILSSIATIDCTDANKALRECRFTIASDVDNPLTGERGASHIYAPQKGADSAMVETLERGMKNYADVVTHQLNIDKSAIAGVGAAGGLGYALLSFMSAELRSGIETVLEATDFEHKAKGVDLIITGEGRLDHQTAMGKAPGGILRVAQRLGIKCIAVGGSIAECAELTDSGFDALYAITPEGMPIAEATKKEVAKENLRHTAYRIAKDYF